MIPFECCSQTLVTYQFPYLGKRELEDDSSLPEEWLIYVKWLCLCLWLLIVANTKQADVSRQCRYFLEWGGPQASWKDAPWLNLEAPGLGFWLCWYTWRPSMLKLQRFWHFRPGRSPANVLPGWCVSITSVKVKCFQHNWLRRCLFPLQLPLEVGGTGMAL